MTTILPHHSALEPTASRFRLVAGASVIVLCAALLGVFVWHQRTASLTVPYADPSSTGRLTLCSADGTTLTSGSVTGQPFAAAIVSSVAAGGPYAAAGRTATLYAFQPRAGVDAGEWSGMPLGAAQTYADAAHPRLAPTAQDTTLGQFLTAYPATDKGWVQLRLVLGGTDVPADATSYATVDLHVSGGTWTVADPGSARCAA
jgi:hypothetical protein